MVDHTDLDQDIDDFTMDEIREIPKEELHEYICTMVNELCKMAQAAEQPHIAHILELAHAAIKT